MDGRMQQVDVAEQLLALLASEGVTLTDDLGQCELAILKWVRSKGAAMLEAHLGGKKAGLPGIEPGLPLPVGPTIRAASPTDDRDAVGCGGDSACLLPLPRLRGQRRSVRRGDRVGV